MGGCADSTAMAAQIWVVLLLVGCAFSAAWGAPDVGPTSTENSPSSQPLSPGLSSFFPRSADSGSEAPRAAPTTVSQPSKPRLTSPLLSDQQQVETPTVPSNAAPPPAPSATDFKRAS